MLDDPPTPDFHDHPPRPLAGALLDGRIVHLDWSDGARLDAFDAWLLEVSVGKGTDPATREGVVDPGTFTDAPLLTAAGIGRRGHLRLVWGDGDVGAVHAGWLHDVATGRLRPDAGLPPVETWTADRLAAPPDHVAAAVLDSDDALDAYLVDLLRSGLARLTGAPLDRMFLDRLGGRIGALRASNFGVIWDVRADVQLDGDPARNSTANTRRRLGPHTDLPSREIPPGFQFLHCLENGVSGGWSTMSDGAAVVARLAEIDPEGHELLSTRHWIFANRGRGLDHRWSGPVIDRGADGTITLRAFHPVRACPDMPAEDVPLAYAALARFHRIAEDPEFLLRFPLRPGDVVGFDNRRILHGRDAYAASGVRHLRGCYVDTDEIRSTARALARRRPGAGPADGSRAEHEPDGRPEPEIAETTRITHTTRITQTTQTTETTEEEPCPTASSSPAP